MMDDYGMDGERESERAIEGEREVEAGVDH